MGRTKKVPLNITSVMIKFIDLFAGLGGMRLGLEQACQAFKIPSQCVLTSEVKPTAIQVYQENFPDSQIFGNIAQVESQNIRDFDLLLAGFPCQPFSSAGTRQGFLDTRGTLFFEIERILRDKQPFGFLLENVEGLVNHDRGRTLKTILSKLTSLGYQVRYFILNAKDFHIPQDRKRIYIVGTRSQPIKFDFSIYLNFQHSTPTQLANILESGLPTLKTSFVEKILAHYSIQELYGKAIKDKRGGADNIHSWDIELKGAITETQKELLNQLLRQRRRKIWSENKGIHWMDGIPLTLEEIASFYPHQHLKNLLDDLVKKGYLKYEHPKDLSEVLNANGKSVKKRVYRQDLEPGYNIVVGKLSFPISKILDPQGVAPTLVATDMQRLGVLDSGGLRHLTIREGLRLFGFPETYQLNLPIHKAFDLLGNTVIIPIIRELSLQILQASFIVSSMKIKTS